MTNALRRTLLASLVALGACTVDDSQDGQQEEAQQGGSTEQTAYYGCWSQGATAVLTSGFCNYSIGNGSIGRRAISGYFSSAHPFTCYLQDSNAPDQYDGGCNGGSWAGPAAASQIYMSIWCAGGQQYNHGWASDHNWDGSCNSPAAPITACHVTARGANC